MAQKTRAELKAFFETGDKPTQQQFSDWLDSYFHKDDAISTENIDGLQLILDAKANTADFNAHVADDVAHVTQGDKDVWNASVSQNDFDAHVADGVAHVTQAARDNWDGKAAGDHIHQDYIDNIAGLDANKADKTHIHIAEMIVSPTGVSAEANSVRFRIDGADAVLESTANGADWIELQRWSRD